MHGFRPQPRRGDTFCITPFEDQKPCAAPTGVPPLPGLHLVVGIRPAVKTAGYKPCAPPRLHYKTRIPAPADLSPELGCTPHYAATVGTRRRHMPSENLEETRPPR